MNHKAVHRIYVEEGLQVRERKRKRVSRSERHPMLVPVAPNERWSMAFQHDLLATGQRFRTLNIVDDFSQVPSDRGRHLATGQPGRSCPEPLGGNAWTRGSLPFADRSSARRANRRSKRCRRRLRQALLKRAASAEPPVASPAL